MKDELKPLNQSTDARDKSRRSFLTLLGTFGVGVVAAPALKMNGWIASASAAEKKPAESSQNKLMAEVARAASECIRTGEACVAHCAREFSSGNSEMAKCNQKVHEMLAVCRAMASLASLESDKAVKLAALCASACRECADACAEHREHFAHGMHLACKDCMEACLIMEKLCKKIQGAAV